MRDQVSDDIRKLLSACIDVPEQELRMDAELVDEYGMDSTELAALAQEVGSYFRIPVKLSNLSTIWATGSDIVDFVVAETTRAAQST